MSSATWEIRDGDAVARLRDMPAGSVQCCVTSPPYYGLRDYSAPGQIGLELTPDQYVAALVEVFRQVRRVLRADGTLWLNIGDSYNGYMANQRGTSLSGRNQQARPVFESGHGRRTSEAKAKDLLGIPWMVAFALRADGWYLRSDIIWAKPNPMPESVTDRPTSAHEHIFLLAKSPRYFYDADAIREASDPEQEAHNQRYAKVYDGPSTAPENGKPGSVNNGGIHSRPGPGGRNKRNVWEVATQPYAGAHFATFPPRLIEPCILAGTSPQACGECGAPWARLTDRTLAEVKSPNSRYDESAGRNPEGRNRSQLVGARSETLGWHPSCDHQDGTATSTILDPFSGAGTTGLVALRRDRSYIGIELNPQYAELSRWRIRDDAPLLNTIAEVAA